MDNTKTLLTKDKGPDRRPRLNNTHREFLMTLAISDEARTALEAAEWVAGRNYWALDAPKDVMAELNSELRKPR